MTNEANTPRQATDLQLLDAATHALGLLEAANAALEAARDLAGRSALGRELAVALTDAQTAELWVAQAQRNLRERADGKLG